MQRSESEIYLEGELERAESFRWEKRIEVTPRGGMMRIGLVGGSFSRGVVCLCLVALLAW